MKLAAAVAAALTLHGCSAAPLPTSSSATFDPLAFFSGRTVGTGTVHRLFGEAVPLLVRSAAAGRTADALILQQTIHEGGKRPRLRRWTMRRIAPGRFTGRLSPDAAGPVIMVVAGPRARIRYRMKGGLAVDQQLALQAGGRTLHNRLEVRKLGLRVAWVDETIRRMD